MALPLGHMTRKRGSRRILPRLPPLPGLATTVDDTCKKYNLNRHSVMVDLVLVIFGGFVAAADGRQDGEHHEQHER